MDQQRQPLASRDQRAWPGRRSVSAALGNSSIPEWQRKALKPSTPASIRRFECAPLSGDRYRHRSRSRPITFLRPRLSFGGQRRSGRSGPANGVERHVDKGGNTAGRRSLCGSGEAFPFGPARFIDMHVDVDKPRQNQAVTHIFERTADGNPVAWNHSCNFSPGTSTARGRNSFGGDHAGASERPIGGDPGSLFPADLIPSKAPNCLER